MTEFSVLRSNVVVVGAGRSGVAAARLLATRGARVTLTEIRGEVGKEVERLREVGVDLELGGHRPETLSGADLVVLSPGVSPSLDALRKARLAGVPVISEIELASRWLRGRIVAVTGTKGKSTTTVLLGRMLEAGGCLVLVGGNVGTALSTQVEQSRPEVIHVVEVSSFQLELTTTFRPWIGVFLNLHADHLDRHTDVTAYAAAKSRLFANQKSSDTLVVNADDPDVLRLVQNSRARRMSYALTEPLNEGVVVSAGEIVCRGSTGDKSLVPLSAVHLTGRHLLSDVLAASAVANLMRVSAEDMTRAVDRFTGLEHVMETVGHVASVRFVNDSKATNVEAARHAVESCGDQLVVIMGGRFKGGPLESLMQLFASRVEAVVAIGEAGGYVREVLGVVVPVVEAESLVDAVRAAYRLASPGGTVLLTPACASLDMFRDYAERGRVFTEAVASLGEELCEKSEQ